VRRKFIDAVDEQREQATPIIHEISKLYLVERHARDECLRPEQRYQLRKQTSELLLPGLRSRVEQVRPQVLPESPLGKAARYCINEWPALTRYLEDGRLELDNNLTENAIRPSAVGKKNWLFIGHPEAGWRSAVIYSMVVSCQRRGIDTWNYLRDVLTRLPDMKQAELPSILPANWKPL
jgi:hypothetical protein